MGWNLGAIEGRAIGRRNGRSQRLKGNGRRGKGRRGIELGAFQPM